LNNNRKIPDKDLKILWGLSAGRCAFPDCKTECIIEPKENDPHAIIGKIAHIYAHSNNGPRSNSTLTKKERDSYSNWILVCSNHHDEIDRQPDHYSAVKLIEMKESHEKWVKETLSNTMPDVGFTELETIIKSISLNSNGSSDSLLLIPPREKIKKNSLSSKVEQYILTGMIKSKEVGDFICAISKIVPSIPEQIISSFVSEYTRLKHDEELNGDDLFEALWSFASSGSMDFIRRSAALAILVNLFEK